MASGISELLTSFLNLAGKINGLKHWPIAVARVSINKKLEILLTKTAQEIFLTSFFFFFFFFAANRFCRAVIYFAGIALSLG